MSFEAICAQLGKLGDVAASAGVVWGQVKGYPFWPVRAAGRVGLGGGVAGSWAPRRRPAGALPSPPTLRHAFMPSSQQQGGCSRLCADYVAWAHHPPCPALPCPGGLQAQVVSASYAAKDADLQAAKPTKGGHHTPVQFFGDCSKGWCVLCWQWGAAAGVVALSMRLRRLHPVLACCRLCRTEAPGWAVLAPGWAVLELDNDGPEGSGWRLVPTRRMSESRMMAWADGCAKGLLKGGGKAKADAIIEVPAAAALHAGGNCLAAALLLSRHGLPHTACMQPSSGPAKAHLICPPALHCRRTPSCTLAWCRRAGGRRRTRSRL